jgi:serine/threonine-protein kinase
MIGRYEVLGGVAERGMGAVYRCRDTVLGRDLAVKVVLDRHANRPDVLRRFAEEARTSGRLQHPGVVPVHELGALPDGRPFLAMKLVEGRTLDDLLKQRPSPAHDLPHFLNVFLSVCQTVAYAHENRVVHRDLKPLNVMVGAFGEVQVMDWGLAKALTGGEPDAGDPSAAEGVRPAADKPQTARGAGTLAYMPPEQARGGAVDERADVFGLGGIR